MIEYMEKIIRNRRVTCMPFTLFLFTISIILGSLAMHSPLKEKNNGQQIRYTSLFVADETFVLPIYVTQRTIQRYTNGT